MTQTRYSKLRILFVLAVICTVGALLLPVPDARAEKDAVYKNLVIFSDVIHEIERNYVDPVQADQLIKKAIDGMVKSLDPHSAFLDPSEYESLHEDTKGEFSGIGIVLTIKDDTLTVIAPIEGTPAFRAGIKAGDVIVKVNGQSTRDMSINEAVNRIKGPKGSRLTLTILRKGLNEPIDMTLVREEIPLDSVRYITLAPGYIYVGITNFNENTGRDLEKALKALEKESKHVFGMILDLRGNPGGLLDQAVAVADTFLKKGAIVSIKGRDKKESKVWEAHDNVTDKAYPMVVLINGGSASASEIVAGALQDQKRALILGTQSFGKGSVQNIMPLPDGSALKLTIARYYTPSGRSIQAEGIKPDIEVAYTRLKKEKVQDTIKEKDLKNHLENIPTEESKPEDDDSAAAEPLKETGVVKATRLNMRKTPEKTGQVIKVLGRGTTFQVVEHLENNWLKITQGNDTGYVSGQGGFVNLESNDSGADEYGKLNKDKMMTDSQVKQALNLLISNRIFSGLGK